MRPPALLLLAALGGAGLSLGGPQPGRGNRCAHIVTRDVSCAVLDGSESFVQAQPGCPWGPAPCPAARVYRVNFRPRYVTRFKTVTQLEWRCCPGFHGPDCQEGPRSPAAGPRPTSARRRNSMKAPDHEPSQASQPRAPLAPTRAEEPRRVGERRPRPQELQEQQIQALEESVLRLTRTVAGLESSLAGVSENLQRAAQARAQDDAGEVRTTWPSSPAPGPASVRGTEMAWLPGVLHSKEPGMKDIKSELAEVRGALKTKSDKLEELAGKVQGYEGRLQQLQEAARGPTATMASAELLQAYVDGRLEALRAELLEGVDRKLGDLKATCEYKQLGLQPQCEDYGSSPLGVLELLSEKEASLRQELGDLRARLQDPVARPGCCDGGTSDGGPQIEALHRKIERVAEAARALNARLDNELERLAAPEAGADFGARWAELDARINAMERRAREQRPGGSALPVPPLPGAPCCAQLEGRWQTLQARMQAELDAVAGGLRGVGEGLGQQVSALWGCVQGLNGTLRAQAGDLAGLQSSVRQFYSHVFQVPSDPRGLVTLPPPPPAAQGPSAAPPTRKSPKVPAGPGEALTASPQPDRGPASPEDQGPALPPQLPQPPPAARPGWTGPPRLPGSAGLTTETGEAGPPGGRGVSGRGLPRGEHGQTGPRPVPSAEGHAGAPGYPQAPPAASPGLLVPALVSFSAGLTQNPFPSDGGVILFNKVLVNDGNVYNPNTGVFTAPYDGRYLLSATLTPERDAYVEAVLSVANASVAQLHTAGYQRELLEYHRPPGALHPCGGPGAFHLVVHLRAGDGVSVVLTGGRLAHADFGEVYSTFSGVFLYPALGAL
ncbi:EMILIN-2 isoform X1 [Heterocephalus glaber]|uniref:EMILIN-2 n=1 Tax=Heterocephalus glaber TaxID=10181 RepID=A0AAX6TK40_HETGA|nr:EMILIN-2 isoform X1 [Heterocephalus glaber]